MSKVKFHKADVIILSVGKSGRTWLRVLINKYLSLHYDIPFDLEDLHKKKKEIPSIIYNHEVSRYYETPFYLRLFKKKLIIPNDILFRKKIIVLCRDSRDVIVSQYFQKTRRSSSMKRKLKCNLSDFIRHKRYGILTIIKTLNNWYERLNCHPDCLWIRYEEIKRDPNKLLRNVLNFVGVENISDSMIKEAVIFSDFKNMKNMEEKGKFDKSILKPADPNDPESFKVRKGKVGGYIDYLNEDDQKYANRALSKLNPHFRNIQNI